MSIERVTSMREYKKRRKDLIEPMRSFFNYHTKRASRRRKPLWRGVTIIKTPIDLMLYAEMMWECQPNWVIECGTRYGGSALFFADILKLTGGTGSVLTIDIEPQWTQEHPFVEYIEGSSIDPKIVKRIAKITKNDKVMVVLDSNHKADHVKNEIIAYSPLVTVGQYLVVEDAYNPSRGWWKPKPAIDWFLENTDQFIREKKYDDKYLLNHSTIYGWLRKVK